MKRITATMAALLALSAPMAGMTTAAYAATAHGAAPAGNVKYDHVEKLGPMKVTFQFVSLQEHLKAANMEMPKGVKETHHLKVDFLDAKTGKPFTEGEAKVKIQGPDKKAQTKDLMAMNNRFCADFDLSQKGRYGVMAKFQLKGGQMQTVKFWYDVK